MLADLTAWLFTPLSGADSHAIAPAIAWHGRLMVAAWGLAVPLAVLLARYYKVTPGQDWPRELDNPFWWHAHRTLNYAAAILTAIGLWLVWEGARHTGPVRGLHETAGWCVAALTLMQITGAHLRGTKGGPTAPRLSPQGEMLDLHGDHYDMSPRRLLFERLHKGLGLASLACGALALVLGLALADAPRWMAMALALWWAGLLAMALRLQRRGRCIDTYQAIWGPDPALPGARLPPVGWGIRRLPPGATDIRHGTP